MSPDPATTNFTSCTFSSTRFAERMKYSGPFCIVIRPRNSTILSLDAIMSPACGWTSSFSIPLYTTSVFFGSTPYRRTQIDCVRLLTQTARIAACIPRRSMSYTR